MTKVFVSDLKPGVSVDSHYMVAKKQLMPFRDPTRGNYLALTLVDRTGRVEAKLWEKADEIGGSVEVESIVRVAGMVEEYRGSIQMTLSAITVVNDDSIDLGDFIPTTSKDLTVLRQGLQDALEGFGDQPIGDFMREWFADAQFYRAYVTAPAAKSVHHSYLGGLLEHSLEVHGLCLTMAEMYPRADRDLLAAAALLHDVGKIEEYSYRRSIDLTDHGRLLGHTVIGYEMVRERGRLHNVERAGHPGQVSESAILHLGHLILTHHGEMEFGAPIVPQTIEAAILHYSDLMSGRVKQFEQLLDGQGEGNWTEYDRILGRSLYRGFFPGK